MKHLFIILFTCLLVPFTNAQSNYFPIEPGMELVYAYSDMFNQGDAALRSKTTMLKEKKTLNGKAYIVNQTSYGSNGNFQVIASSYARKADDGTVYVLPDSKEKEFVMMSANPKTGDVWTRKSDDGKNLEMKVISTSKSVKTPVKTYSDCLVLETTEAGTTLRSYFKNDVGMVAIFMVVEGKEQLFTYLVK